MSHSCRHWGLLLGDALARKWLVAPKGSCFPGGITAPLGWDVHYSWDLITWR